MGDGEVCIEFGFHKWQLVNVAFRTLASHDETLVWCGSPVELWRDNPLVKWHLQGLVHRTVPLVILEPLRSRAAPGLPSLATHGMLHVEVTCVSPRNSHISRTLRP
jgi:hypothetical protein